MTDSSGVLRPWQRRLYRLLLIPLGLIAANAIFLVAFTRDTSFFYVMLLLHLLLGVAIAIPFFVFAATHARRMIRMWNKRAKYAGLAIATLAVICVSSGVFMTFKGATLNHRAIWIAHVASVPLALVAFILHRRAHTHQLQFRRLYAWGGAVAVFLAAMALAAKLEKPPRRIVNVNGDTVFFPSSSETFDQGLLDAKTLSANDYCQSCHPDSFHEWERSAHRFSSFNNPFYRKSVELMADRVGRERTKWCSGCHDPVVLFTGQMGAATQAKFSYDAFEAQQGLTCMSCHSIVEVKGTAGNGGYVIEEARQYPFAFSSNAALKEINRLLIRMEPSLHRKTFLKPLHRTPEFCAACHKVALIPALNDYRWIRGQDHYDTWYDSGVSGRAVRSFYDPPQPKACRDCHLPPYRSGEFGSRGGQLHDHLFPAANTALPFIAGRQRDGEAHPGVPADKVLTVDLFAIKRGGETLLLGDRPPSVSARARRWISRSSSAREAWVIPTRTAQPIPTRRGSRWRAGTPAAQFFAAACWTKTAGSTRPRQAGARSRGSRRLAHGPAPAPGHPRTPLQQRHRAGGRARRPLPPPDPGGRAGARSSSRPASTTASSRGTTRRSPSAPPPFAARHDSGLRFPHASSFGLPLPPGAGGTGVSPAASASAAAEGRASRTSGDGRGDNSPRCHPSAATPTPRG